MKNVLDPRLMQIWDALYRVSAKAIIICDGKILLTLEVPEQNFYGAPGGGIDYGESPHETIIRELSEELHLKLTDDQISAQPIHLSVGNIFTDGKCSNGRGIPFVYFYYQVTLADGQKPIAGDNNFLWADLAKLKSLNFASNQAPDKPFYEKFLKENS